jgi:hypothetical protein
LREKVLRDDEDLPDFQGLAADGILVGFLDFVDAVLGVAGIHLMGNFPKTVAFDYLVGFAGASVRAGGRGSGGGYHSVGVIQGECFLRTSWRGVGAGVRCGGVGRIGRGDLVRDTRLCQLRLKRRNGLSGVGEFFFQRGIFRLERGDIIRGSRVGRDIRRSGGRGILTMGENAASQA